MANLKNTVNPLTWNVPITNSDGTPTNEFMRKWAQQATANGRVPDLVTGQALHTVFAASPSGPSQPPAFRLLAVADIPNLLSLYDAAGAAAAALVTAEAFATAGDATTLAAAEAFSANATNLTSGTVAIARLPVATGAALGVVKPDGVTITIAGGVISAVASGSSGGAASIQDDGTNIYLALSDADGQLVLDGSGDPVFMLEVFPVAAIPALAVGGYLSGTTAAAQVNKVKGVTDASNAAVGDVGEFNSASRPAASAVALATTGDPSDVTSILLQPGDYDVWGSVGISNTISPTSVNYSSAWISTTSATFPSPFPDTSFAQADYHGLTMSGDQVFAVGVKRVNVSVATTVYLTARAGYSGGNIVAYGIIAFRRRR